MARAAADRLPLVILDGLEELILVLLIGQNGWRAMLPHADLQKVFEPSGLSATSTEFKRK